jgi:MFS family permease
MVNVSNLPNKAAVSKSRNLFGACLTHVLRDGYTDQLYALLPAWQTQFGLSYMGLAMVRALYYGTMGGLQIPADRFASRLRPRSALALSSFVAAFGFVAMALPTGFAGLWCDRSRVSISKQNYSIGFLIVGCISRIFLSGYEYSFLFGRHRLFRFRRLKKIPALLALRIPCRVRFMFSPQHQLPRARSGKRPRYRTDTVFLP